MHVYVHDTILKVILLELGHTFLRKRAHEAMQTTISKIYRRNGDIIIFNIHTMVLR